MPRRPPGQPPKPLGRVKGSKNALPYGMSKALRGVAALEKVVGKKMSEMKLTDEEPRDRYSSKPPKRPRLDETPLPHEIEELKLKAFRVKKDVPPEVAEAVKFLAGETLETYYRAMKRQLGIKKAFTALKAASLIRSELCDAVVEEHNINGTMSWSVEVLAVQRAVAERQKLAGK